MTGSAAPWTVVLPLKGGPDAKSRLGGSPALARALALDTLGAVLAARAAGVVGAVLVVTGDPEVATRARTLGAAVVDERPAAAGLDAAVRAGLAAAPAGAPAGVLLGDLPALTAADVAAVLDAVEALLAARPDVPAVVVPDADGTGSVLLAGRRPADLDPAFGPGSAAGHVRRGAVRLTPSLPRLRRDVDTPADLAAAAGLGLGPRTRAALAAERWTHYPVSLPTGFGEALP